MTHLPRCDHAIIVGASMAGLLAARVLSDHFARITLIERDRLPLDDEPRKGVPQAMHAHGLLARGREIIEGLLPGITDELTQQGALYGDMTRDVVWHAAGAALAEYASGMMGLIETRPLLEAQLRRRVLALPNVAVMQDCEALDLLADPGRARITGLRIDDRVHGCQDTIPADLVVDAAGPGSRTPSWLAALGYAPPAVEEVRIGITYTTRYYRREAHQLGGKLGYIITAQPPNRRYAAMVAQEGERWVVTAGGYLGERAAASDAEFLDYLRALPSPAIYEAVREAEAVSPFYTFNFPASVRRRYEQLSRVPAGLLAIGDAVSRFNPVYGQGMTSAALQADALRRCLAQGMHDLARRAFRAIARVVDNPWAISVGSDLRYPAVRGSRPPMVRFFNWYVERLHRAAHSNVRLADAFMCVANLTVPPTSLLRPAIALRVLGSVIGARMGDVNTAPASRPALTSET